MSSVSRMTKVQKLLLNAAREELKPWGYGSILDMGGKHPVLRFWDRTGEVHRLTLSSTPRCGEAAAGMVRQKARRIIRQINKRLGY